MTEAPKISVNSLAGTIVDRMVAEADKLRIIVSEGSLGETLIDAGVKAVGGFDVGLLMAEICLGGLGTVTLTPYAATAKWPFHLTVRTADPVIACLASQYAGWALSHEKWFALGSGPGPGSGAQGAAVPGSWLCRQSQSRDPGHRRRQAAAAGSRREGRQGYAASMRDHLTFIYAPTRSLAGSLQVVARVLEVALHKAHELKFPLSRIIDGIGTAPLSPPHPDFIQAMGRTNDAIIYGGLTHLFVTGPADEARALAEKLPSKTSRDYGEPFSDIFKKFKGDFYKIDPMLFSPAVAVVTAVESGETFFGGEINESALNASFS